jgi:hypothetical protein
MYVPWTALEGPPSSAEMNDLVLSNDKDFLWFPSLFAINDSVWDEFWPHELKDA